MSEYPGQAPDPSGDQGHPEHTAPITPQNDPQSGEPVWNPTSAQPPYSTPEQQPAYGQPSYPPQPSYGQPSYGQPSYPPPPPSYGGPTFAPQFGPPGFGSPYAAFQPVRADHPQSTTAMVLGIVGLAAGFLFCGVGFLVSPFAWALGRRSLKDIQASQGQLGGESQARAGMIMGIVGTVLLVLAIVALVLFIVALATSSTVTSDFSSTNA